MIGPSAAGRTHSTRQGGGHQSPYVEANWLVCAPKRSRVCDDAGMASSGAVRSRPSNLSYLVGGLALAVLAAMSILFFAAGLMAPLWAVIVFSAIWVTIFVLGCLWIRRHPLRVVILPVIAALIWFGGMTAGEQLLGWTA